MRNVKVPCYGGVQYGYAYQAKDNKRLRQKLTYLQKYGCTHIYCDVGSRDNLNKLLAKVTFRDHILFYDHGVFQTIDEADEVLFSHSLGDYEENIGFEFAVHDHDLFPKHSPEYTAKTRRQHERQRLVKAIVHWFVKPYKLIKPH